MTRHGVVVGVAGREEDTAALRFGAAQAALIGAEVTVAHVVHLTLPPPPPSPMVAFEPRLDIGRGIVRAAADRYHELTGEQCRTVVEKGVPAVELTRLSESADVVVLGHRHLSAAARLLTRSTTVAVAAHASCPVVAAPTVPSSAAGADDVVTVGTHEKGGAERVLRTAFEMASQRGARLRILHAWHLDPEYDDLVAGRTFDEWTAQVEQELRAAAEQYAGEYPDVKVEAVVRHQWPPEALVEASKSSALLVIGRHESRAHLPMRLGSLARVVLHHAEGPVVVVPTT